MNANDCDFPPTICPFDGTSERAKWKLKKEKEVKADGNLDK